MKNLFTFLFCSVAMVAYGQESQGLTLPNHATQKHPFALIKNEFRAAALDSAFTKYEVFEMPLDDVAKFTQIQSGIFSLSFQFGLEKVITMELIPVSLWDGGTKCYVASEDGVKEMAMPRSAIYRGTLNGERLSTVACSFAPEFSSGMIETENGAEYWEPLFRFIPNSQRNLIVRYNAKDVKHFTGLHCAVDDKMKMENLIEKQQTVQEKILAGCYELELAQAADWTMWQKYGGAGGVIGYMASVINMCQSNFDNEFTSQLNFRIVGTWLSSCSNCDPWSNSTEPNDLLNSFTSWGNSPSNWGINFDIGQFWTNRDLNGATVGLAWVDVPCNSGFRYHIIQDWTTGSYLRTTVSHEIGHNLGASHDAANSPYIMAPASNGTNSWSSASQGVMSSFIQNRINDGCYFPCSQFHFEYAKIGEEGFRARDAYEIVEKSTFLDCEPVWRYLSFNQVAAGVLVEGKTEWIRPNGQIDTEIFADGPAPPNGWNWLRWSRLDNNLAIGAYTWKVYQKVPSGEYLLVSSQTINIVSGAIGLLCSEKMHLPLNGNTNDISGSGNHAIAQGGSVTYDADRFGNCNAALRLNGGKYLEAPIINERAVSFWFKLNQQDQMVIYDSGPNAFESKDYRIGVFKPNGLYGSPSFDNNTFGVFFNTWDRDIAIPFDAVKTGWHHIVVSRVHDGFERFRIMIDGQFPNGYMWDGFPTVQQWFAQDQPFALPGGGYGVPNLFATDYKTYMGRDFQQTNEFFDGWLDEVRVFNQLLDINEMTSLYNAPNTGGLSLTTTATSACTGANNGSATVTVSGGTTPYSYLWNNGQTTATAINLTPGTYTVTVTSSGGCLPATASVIVQGIAGGIDCGLVAHYKFDDSINDSSGNGNNGTAPNGITYTEDHFGICNQAAKFNGTNAYVSATASTSLNSPTTGISLMGWARAESDGAIQSMVAKSLQGSSTLHYRVSIVGNQSGAGSNANKIHFAYKLSGQSVATTSSVQIPNLDITDWTHYVVTWNGTTVRFYWNGAEVGNGAALSGIILPNNPDAPLEMGRDIHSELEYFNGDLDEIRVYNRALSSDEIAQLYNAPPDAPLTATVSTTTPACPGLSDGSATVTASGGVPPYTYHWLNNQMTATASNLAAASYTVTVTGSNGCSTTAAATIGTAPATTSNFTFSVNAQTVSFANTSTNATSYSWDFGDSQTSTQTNPSHTYAAAGTYNVCITATGACGSMPVCKTITVCEPGSDCGLVAHYKFDNTLIDNSENGNNGSAPNGITYGEDRFGNCNQAAHFLGSGPKNYISVPSSVSLNSPTTGITLTGWAKSANAANGLASLICKVTDGADHLQYRFGIALNKNMYISYVLSSQGTYDDKYALITDPNFSFTNWNQYAVTWDGSVVRFYLNGDTIGSSQPLSGTLQAFSDAPLELGRDAHGPDEYVNGYLDDLKIYNRGLSSDEIAQLYNAPPDAPLTATVSTTTPACAGQSDGSATVTASGGVPPYTYNWSGQQQSTATITNLTAGTYTVTVTGSNGCTTTAAATIGTAPATTSNFTFSANAQTVSFANTSTNATSYSWDFGDGQTATQPSPSHTYANAGVYEVCLMATGVCGGNTFCQTIIFAPPGWDVEPCNTGIVHTVGILSDAITSIEGQPLEQGDLVGFFHTDASGANICNNFGTWQGTALVLELCGDNPATPSIKEGFELGENFLVKVWKNNTEHNVIACFVPEDTYGTNNPNATGSFAPFGLSYVECLKTPPAPGTDLGCSSPIPIACGETKTGNTANGISSSISYNCFYNLVDGPEVVYEFINPIAQNVLITLTGLQEDLEVLLLDACDRNSCLFYSDRTGTIPEALLANNLPAGTYYIIVEGYLGSDSPYSLNVTCGSNGTNNSTLNCSGAITAQCGQTVSGTTSTGSDQIVQYGCSPTYNSGKEKIYILTLPENKVVGASLFGLSADLNLLVLDACNPNACVAISEGSGTQNEGVLFFAAAGKTYYIVVDGYFDAEGPYSLSISCGDPCTDPADCPPNDYDLNGPGGGTGGGTPCELAQVLECGVPISGNNNNGNAFADSYSCPNSYTTGKEVIYKFTIDETQDVTLILSGLSANLDLYLLDDCSVFNCHAASHKIGTSDEGMVVQALAAGTYYVVVDGYNSAAISGYSLLVNCTNSALTCQTIDLVAGTNFISSNILPLDPAIGAMFPPSAQSKIISIESQTNLSYSPNAQTDPAVFGDWDFRKAYRIKAIEPVTVEVCGEKADPDTPIPFVALTPQGQAVNNWSAYLKDAPALVGDKFTPTLTPKLFRVWNMPTGPNGTLMPQSWSVTLQAGFNFQLTTGRGYILNATEDGEYSFGFWSGGLDNRSGQSGLPLVVENGCTYFQTPFFNSMKAVTVILPQTVLEEGLSLGDEIGVFRQDGSLFGSGKYNGFALSLVVGGDETATPDFSEGFSEGEAMVFRLWKSVEGKVFDLKATFQSGNGDFKNEAVYFVDGLEVLEPSAVQTPKMILDWAVYPNPARETVWFDLFLPQSSNVHLELFSTDGRQLRSFADYEMPAGRTVFHTETDKLVSGCYLVKMTTEQGVSFKKIIISKN